MGKESYEQFVEKFKPKKTTDDCYTPDNIYNVIADWVANEYGLDRKNFVRPFWPGAEYTEYEYKDGQVVVDNPPFSIEAKIMKFYKENNIKFFLFAPALTLLRSYPRGDFCCIGVGAPIVYDNGAVVSTSFVTNLEPDNCAVRSCPELYELISTESKNSKTSKTMPKYDYPNHVLTSAMINQLSKYGVDYSVKRNSAFYALGLDSQKQFKKSFFGGGLLLSEKAAAEKAAAEKAAAEKAAAEKVVAEKVFVWELSDREKEIIKKLN